MTLYIEPKVMQIAAGDTGKKITITIGDDDGLADFTTVSKADVRVRGVVGPALVVDGEPEAFAAAVGGATAEVTYAFGPGETDGVGRMWVSVVVNWGGTDPQTFPDDMPLRLDFTRAAGTA